MADIKITDLVDEKVFEELNKLSQGIKEVKQQYIDAANELAKGLNIKVSSASDLQKLNESVTESTKKAQQATEQLNESIDKQRTIVGQTTNVISRELAEIEKENKAKRDAFAQDKNALDIAQSILGTRDQNILRLSKLQTELKSVTDAQKSLDTAVKSGTVSESAAVAKRAEYLEQQRTLKAAIADINGVLNNQDKQMQAAEGSYQQLSLQLEYMKKAYKSLNDEEKNSEIGTKLGEEIGNMDAHLKDLAADMGEFQRNTGNYAIAQGSVRTEMRQLIQEIAMLTLQYRNMSEEEKIGAEGKELEQKIQKMTLKAADLKDAMSDVNRAVTAGANDTKTFSAIADGINMVVSGFGSMKSAAQLLGLGEKDLIKVQTQLQAALQASNALKVVQNNIQKESNLMMGVARLQELAHAAAIKMKTAAESESIIVSKAATVAQAAFNAVAKANPYVLLATGIGLAIAALIHFTSDTKEETEEMKKQREEAEKLKKEYDDLVDTEKQLSNAREKGIEDSADEIAQLQILYTAATDVSRSLKERKQAVDKLQEIYPDYFKSLSDEAIMAGNAAKEYDKLREAIINKAIAEAKQDLIKDYAAKYVKSLGDMRKATEQLNKVMEKLGYTTAKMGDKTVYLKTQTTDEDKVWQDRPADVRQTQTITGRRKTQLENQIKQYQQEQADYKRAMKEIIDTIDVSYLPSDIGGGSSSGGSSTSGGGNSNTTTKQETAKSLEEIKAIILEYTKETIQERISLTEEGSKEEYDLTLKYVDVELMEKKAALKEQYTEDKEDLQKSLDLKQISQEEYNEQIAAMEQNYNEQSTLLEQEALKVKEEARKKYTDAVIKKIEEQYDKEQNERNNDLLIEQTKLANQRANKIIDEEGYQQKLAELQQKYAEETANKQIEMLEKVLETENLTAEEREKIAKKLKEVKIKAEKDAADNAVKQTKKTEKEDDKSTEKRKKNLNKYLQTASKMIGQINSLVSTIYDGQLKKIEEEEEANEDAYDAEIERIENLQETGAISEEEAEARKTAAKEREEAKEEELEKKKQEIKYKQAMWEKVTSIAQAGIATALAITEALPNMVLAALVGALGAVEVATIIATPISTYAKGTGKDGHKGGLALVGDGGKQEAVVYGDKMWITPDTPTLVDMPKGAMVYPDASNIPEPVLQTTVLTGENQKPIVIVNADNRKLERGVDKNNKLLKQAILSSQKARYDANYQAYKARL